MIDTTHANSAMRHSIRRILLIPAVTILFSMQGCATSLETFGLGAGVGIVGVFGLLGCAIGCH
ncbi:hypothetical protein PQQ65_21850 [Paraburkholderia strydomiana]|uniref:hypothetical protein n=1 Tax=Paraburkholderia strydomiana TaxID=1245417 RepID=UPI0038BC9FFC